jgi:hypothetical protein
MVVVAFLSEALSIGKAIDWQATLAQLWMEHLFNIQPNRTSISCAPLALLGECHAMSSAACGPSSRLSAFTFVDPSGFGKSSNLRCLNRLVEPSSASTDEMTRIWNGFYRGGSLGLGLVEAHQVRFYVLLPLSREALPTNGSNPSKM